MRIINHGGYAALGVLVGMSIINTLAKASRERSGAERAFRQHVLRDHVRILTGLTAHDPATAVGAMAAHLDHVERALAKAGRE